MYLGYQNGKIKFYTEQPLDKELYNLEKIEETQEIYVLDGEEYVFKNEAWEEKQAQKEQERINKLKLTKREVFLAIYKDLGITPDEIKAEITNPSILIEFEYANEYYRGNPLISEIGLSLGYSEKDLDYLFENKKFPEATKEVKENA